MGARAAATAAATSVAITLDAPTMLDCGGVPGLFDRSEATGVFGVFLTVRCGVIPPVAADRRTSIEDGGADGAAGSVEPSAPVRLT